MIRRFYIVFYFFLIWNFISCSNKKDTGSPVNLSQDQITEQLLDANKAALILENNQIDKLIVDKGWSMIKTSTGLRYQIIEKGNGQKTIFGKIVSIEYEVKLISDEIIYSSEQTGFKEFRIGSGGVESGLEEGILLLQVGDKARLIIPSYLAHGLAGDQDKIPPKATLIYTLKVIEIK